MDVNAVMDGLGVRLATISGLRVLDYPAENVPVPCAVVSFPGRVEYDSTMARGADEATFEVHVLVGRVEARTARDKLAAYMAGSGSSSVKAAIEGDVTLAGAADSLRVTEASPVSFQMGGQDLLAATFQIHVIA